jgi:ABC-type bacteriocin/lantibiotic exporter with double-glycine peptidase domain
MKGAIALLSVLVFCCSASLCVCGTKSQVFSPQEGVLCGPTALAYGLGILGLKIGSRDVARSMYVSNEGVSLEDLNARATELAGASLLVTLDDVALERAVHARLPAIVAVKRGDSPHLVLVVDRNNLVTTYIDPRDGEPHKLAHGAFRAEQTLASKGIVFGPSERIAAYATPAQLAEDRRNRALSLVKQASEHKTANPQVLFLLADAVRADPCWPDARRLLALAAQKLGTTEPDGLPGCVPQ